MPNSLNLQGNDNIVVQHISDSTITLNVNGNLQDIRHDLAELKALLQKLGKENIQVADKIYNIGHIDEANFGVVLGSHVFNRVLVRRLMETLPAQQDFLDSIPAAERAQWEYNRTLFKDARKKVEEAYVWVIAYELRRLFSIGQDAGRNSADKMEEYLEHCFRTQRAALQLTVFLLVAILWDIRQKQPALQVSLPSLAAFFRTTRPLSSRELRSLLLELLRFFQAQALPLPPLLDGVQAIGDPQHPFHAHCQALEDLENLPAQGTAFGLPHGSQAETALAGTLEALSFLANCKMALNRRVEYLAPRNTPPRYVRESSTIGKADDAAGAVPARLRCEPQAPNTCAVFFVRDRENAVNLFPFVLDYNVLSNQPDFHIALYECREGKSGLRFFSVHSEQDLVIHFKDTQTDLVIRSEEQKNEEQKNLRLDTVIREFEAAMNTLLDTQERFQAQGTQQHVPDF